MSNIIGIHNLKDVSNGKYFGFEGIDLETGKIRYFTDMDEFGNYQDDILYEFDFFNPNTEYLRNALKNCYHERFKFSAALPDCIKKLTELYIKTHRNYNVKNGLPTDMLDFNIQNLSVSYEVNFFDFINNTVTGIYNGIKNSITLNVSEEKWKNLKFHQRAAYKNILLHEIGHAKSSRILLQEKDEIVIQKIGVSNVTYGIKRKNTNNGDVFWFPINSPKNTRDERSIILEEILNDYECSKMQLGFQIEYPNFGKTLNELCDNNLLMARYTTGMDVYYDYLTRLIESDSLANELLDIFIEIEKSEGKEERKYEQEARKLIREYQKAKKGKLK